MSKLDELIQELCPNGVEYKELGDVVTFLNGRAYKQNELLDSGKYKVLRVGNFYTNNQWYYSNLELDDNKYCQKGDLLYTWAATLGPQIWNGEKVIYHYHIWKLIYDDSILNKHYLFHYLKKDINDISNSLTNSTMPHVSMSSMKKRIIPIPPMEVQQEIVRLLDEFTAKTAELQAELNKEYEARKKQYEYYRDTLLMQKSLFINNNKTTDFLYDIELICSKVNVELSKDPEIKEQQCSYYKEIIKTYNETGKIPSSLEQTKKMSIIKIIQYLYGYANVNLLDVANNYTGLTYKPSDKADYGTLVLRSSNIVNNRLAYDDNVFVQMETIPQRAIAKENDILVCVRNGSRALIGKSAIIPHTQTPMAFGAFMTVLRANPTLLNYKYLYFVWQTNYVQNLIHGDEAMPINQITNKEFKRIHFALPTLNEQNALVQKLEKLEETSFELQSNISVELESRQKQYEYYRDKLLTFKELNESEVN